MTRTYVGTRRIDRACEVNVRDENGRWHQLRMRLDLANHSPTGFEWGYAGSGPAQLALAILADALGNDRKAMRLHQNFKFKVITKLAREDAWWMTQEQVLAFVKEYEGDATDDEADTDAAIDPLPSGPVLDSA